ncbi:DNA-binding protein [Nocardia farcinica]|uniref:DNA-binding protein n=1 Tax=Nocardia farcinica TaxID=37329 RepID=UPI002458BB0D|nr:DNA-binding protein [Nocardia farcinica]
MTGQQCARCGRVRNPLRRGMCGACYEWTRSRQTAYGRWTPDRVSTALVRAHIQALRDSGVSLRRIPGLAGLSRSTVNGLVHGRPGRGPAKFVSRATAEAILAVPVPADPVVVAADNARVPAIGAQRRLRALVAAGWTMTYLAEQLGMEPGNFSTLIHRTEQVTARRHRDIAALFDRLQMQPGPSERARIYARRRRWALPLQWDEDTIDLPEAKRARRRREQAEQVAS